MELFSPEHDIVRSLAEKLIRTAAKIANVEKIEAQLRKSPHPVFLPVMDACLEEINKIEHERTRVLLHDMIILSIWKMEYSNSFRHPAISILEKLSTVLPGLPYRPYLREPQEWKINIFARAKKRKYEYDRREEAKKDEQGKA